MDWVQETSAALWGGGFLLLAVVLLVWNTAAQQGTLPARLRSSPWWMPSRISNTLRLRNPPPPEQAIKEFKDYGGAFMSANLLGDSAYIYGPTALRWTCRSDSPVTMSIPSHWQKLLGDNTIALTQGEEHKRLRAIVSTAFTPAVLAAFAPLMQSVTTEFLTEVARRSTEEAIDPYIHVKKFALDVAVVNMLGTRMDDDPRCASLLKDYSEWLEGLSTFVPVDLPFTTFGKAMRARRKILATMKLILDERRAMEAQGLRLQRHDTLSKLMATQPDGSAMTEPQILDALLGFIFAGHDTAAASICSAFYVVAHQLTPEQLQRVRDEITDAFPTPAGPIEHRKLEGLPYLNAFVKELMRLYCPVRVQLRAMTRTADYQCPFAPAKTSTSDKDISSLGRTYTFRKGMSVIVPLYLPPLDSKDYVRPQAFEPERFLPGREEDKKAPYTYAPWGGGNRKCLGQALATFEIKMFMVQLIRDYDLQTVSYKKLDFPIAGMRPVVHLRPRS